MQEVSDMRMQEASDMELLRQYAHRNSDEAFAALVTRHVNMVYCAALRKTGNAHAAEEITQAVFIILARKAGRLSQKTILSGWLYQATRLTAANLLRTEIRRVRREQEACMQSPTNETESEVWPQLAPLLEDAMGRLGEKDRNAIALRFFEGKSFQEIGAAFGASENAAKKRVAHALEKLRRDFSKHGVASTAAIIAGAISAHSVQAAPAALAKSVTAVAIAKGAAAGGSTLTLVKGALKIMAWTKMKSAIVITAVAFAGAGTATVTVKMVSHYREQSVWNNITRCDLTQLERAPPTVSIRPTRFTRELERASGTGGKILALYQPFDSLIARAYDTSPCRVLDLTPLPQGNFDFITSIPQRQKEALQEMIKQKFGITGRRERRESDVLLLTLRRNDAPGLKPTSSQAGNSTSNEGVGHLTRADGPIDFLIYDLQYYLRVPVVDRTGLGGRFDIDLKWDDEKKWDSSTERYCFSNPDGLKQAVLDQLGLELVPSREPIEMLVVEKAK